MNVEVSLYVKNGVECVIIGCHNLGYFHQIVQPHSDLVNFSNAALRRSCVCAVALLRLGSSGFGAGHDQRHMDRVLIMGHFRSGAGPILGTRSAFFLACGETIQESPTLTVAIKSSSSGP